MSKPNSKTLLLDKAKWPADLRKLNERDLPQLAAELRQDLVASIAQTGGHLGAGLGVVELSIALHYLFDTPRDKIIWDVGHQAYPHKILTGRRAQMPSIRQPGGLSGFCKPSESEYDVFGAGHSSTSISAGLGMAVARDKRGENHEIIAVIGDGAMSAGMAYEAMNNAGALDSRLIVILNDNDMSIAPPTGALSAYLSRIISSHSYQSLRDIAKSVTKKLPEGLARAAKSAESHMRTIATGGTLFEALGFYYVGPVDGNNLEHLIPVLKNVRDQKHDGPVLVHVVTKKGHGYQPAENAADKYHGVGKFDAQTGEMEKAKPALAPSYTSVFAKALIQEAEKDEAILGITAAMPSGTGMDAFGKAFPDRMFDVGIAEQHAVTFAAGLALEGYKPFCAIYSTFLQRAYDQLVHDVAIQNLPVRFAIDRAGLVGADGPTHAGAFDVAYLTTLPNMVVMAAGDEADLVNMVHTAARYDAGPIAFRFPRGEGLSVAMPEVPELLEIGKGRVLAKGRDVALLNFGGRLGAAKQAAKLLEEAGISVTLADARFAKPLDGALIADLLQNHALVITLEEGAHGGFGAHVAEYAHNEGLLDGGTTRLRSLTLPDQYQPHGKPEAMYDDAGLSPTKIAEKTQKLLAQTAKQQSSKVA